MTNLVARLLLVFLAVLAPLACRSAPRSAPCLFSSEPRSRLAWQRGGESGELWGRVLRVNTGEPLPRALIFVEPGGHRAQTDSAGRFRLSRLAPGSYEVRVGHIGLAEARDSLTLGHAGLELVAALAVPNLGLEACVTPASGAAAI